MDLWICSQEIWPLDITGGKCTINVKVEPQDWQLISILDITDKIMEKTLYTNLFSNGMPHLWRTICFLTRARQDAATTSLHKMCQSQVQWAGTQDSHIAWCVHNIGYGLDKTSDLQATHSRNTGLQSPPSIIPYWCRRTRSRCPTPLLVTVPWRCCSIHIK
jgi:hypothetical protein